MCKRKIIVCPMCKAVERDLTPCKEYDKDKYPNMFSSGWFYEHAKRNRNNVKNSVKLMFCTKCEMKNSIHTQPECDNYYGKQIKACVKMIESSYVGQVELRHRIGFGYIFLY